MQWGRSTSICAKREFFAVVGPSGCGKSTMLELIAGLTTASKGSVEFEGNAIGNRIPDGVGVVFQEDASFPWMTARNNIEFGLRRTKLSRKKGKGAFRAPLT